MSKVSAEDDGAGTLVARGQLAYHIDRTIPASIVHEQNLEDDAGRVERGTELFEQNGKILLLVVRRHDDAKIGRHGPHASARVASRQPAGTFRTREPPRGTTVHLQNRIRA